MNRERSPIDIYRERHAKNINIEVSRNIRLAADYNLKISGLDKDKNIDIENVSRKVCETMIKYIHNTYRAYNIIYKNSTTKTIIRDWMLYRLTSLENTERSRDRTIDATKRGLNKFGRTPSILKGRRKPTDSKTMPPIEKTW